MAGFPPLFQSYALSCKLQVEAVKSGKTTLPSSKIIFPSTILPLVNSGLLTRGPGVFGPTWIELPKDPAQRSNRLREYSDSTDLSQVCGGPDVFNYLLNEIVDNIYQHSEFTRAMVLAKRFNEEKFTELAFLDDGLTIPKVLQKHGRHLNQARALQAAASGTSTKGPERGYGLSTSIRLVREGFKGDFLLVSGGAALSANREKTEEYVLDGSLALEGTLVALRIPFMKKVERFYEYIS